MDFDPDILARNARAPELVLGRDAVARDRSARDAVGALYPDAGALWQVDVGKMQTHAVRIIDTNACGPDN